MSGAWSPEVVARCVADIAAYDDDEVQHSEEDALYRNILRGIANGTVTDPAATAREALKTQALTFARWCA